MTDDEIKAIWRSIPPQGDASGLSFAVAFAREVLAFASPVHWGGQMNAELFTEIMRDLDHICAHGDPGSQETAHDARDRLRAVLASALSTQEGKPSDDIRELAVALYHDGFDTGCYLEMDGTFDVVADEKAAVDKFLAALAATPSPTQARASDAEDARDAARYRWLRSVTGPSLDSTTDSAISAGGEA